MGTLRYGTLEVEFNDMLLAHLQVLIGMKLRRRENFMLSWVKPHELGSGRQSLWIDNGFPISFEFDGGQFPQISREWVEAMAMEAAGASGLHLTSHEPPESALRPH